MVLKYIFSVGLIFSVLSPALAQQNSQEEAARREAALNSLPQDAARRLFFLKKTPAPLEVRSIGAYGRGCVAGAKALAFDGPSWQVMRLSRNRNWGHPKLVLWIEQFSSKAVAEGWPGVLVGDMAQPRGGPMLTGHASHQLGLEADIWMTPARQDRRFSKEEREEMSAINMVKPDLLSVFAERFTDGQYKLLKLAASMPDVDRIFINAAIKKAMCERTTGDRAFLRKLRPWSGHTFHFHVSLKCPVESTECKSRPEIPEGDGCGKDLDHWFKESVRFPKPNPNAPPPKIITIDDMPAACRAVVAAE